MKYVYFILFIFVSLSACKRFDSNKKNLQLIQGSWVLSSIWNKEADTAMSSHINSKLHFSDTICTEFISDSIVRENKYQYQINNYKLFLLDSQKRSPNILLINKLIKDTLILENDAYLFKYIHDKIVTIQPPSL